MSFPSWESDSQQKALEVSCINQFLSIHGASAIYRRYDVSGFTAGSLETYQPIGGIMVDQKGVGGTIGFVRIPVTINDQPSPDTNGYSNLYEEAVDMTVSIYADSGGNLGALLARTVVPADAIQAVCSDAWTEPQDVLLGPLSDYPQALFPFAPGDITTCNKGALAAGQWAIAAGQNYAQLAGTLTSGSANATGVSLSAGATPAVGWEVWGLGIPPGTTIKSISGTTYTLTNNASINSSAGFNATDTAQIWCAEYDGQDLGAWQSLTTLPTSGVGVLTYCPTAELLIAQAGTAFYSASFAQDGTIGAWQQVTTLPTAALYQCALTVLTYNGVDYLQVAGGYLFDASINPSLPTRQTYWAPVDSSGATNAWTQGEYTPVGVSSPSMCPDWFQFNGWPYIQDPVYGHVYFCQTPGGQWQLGAESANTFSFFAQGSIVALNGNIPLSPQGQGAWGVNNNVSFPGFGSTAAAFDNPDGSSSVFWCLPQGFISQTMDVFPTNWITVPIGVNVGSNAHLVIQGASGTPQLGASVPLVQLGALQSAVRISTNGGTSWTTSSWGLPLILGNPTSGDLRLIGLIEDGAARCSTMWFDTNTGQMLAALQWTPNFHQASITAASAVVTCADIPDVGPGMAVTGMGIPPGTTVLSIAGGQESAVITLSSKATITCTTVLVFGNSTVAAQTLGYTGGVLASVTEVV